MSHPTDRTSALTIDRVQRLLAYDPESGVFSWLVKRAGKNVGDLAGCLSDSGYVVIGIDGRLYRAHRLAWFYIHGRWPVEQIDHVNMTRNDNRIANLRLASSQQNKANRRKAPRNRSGLKGVHWDADRQAWAAFIKINSKSRFLGRHASKEKAHAAYLVAATKLFGEFSRAA